MTESEVWKHTTRFLLKRGATILCGSPPGATSYAYKNCNLNFHGKVDSPDIMFIYANSFFICECKGNFADLNKQNVNGESDFDKLLRMQLAYHSGEYDEQIKNNFSCDVHTLTGIRVVISYASKVTAKIDSMFDYIAITPKGTTCSF